MVKDNDKLSHAEYKKIISNLLKDYIQIKKVKPKKKPVTFKVGKKLNKLRPKQGKDLK